METPKSKRQLYNLARDPGERNNVLQQNSSVAQKLHEQITEIVLNGRSTTGPPRANDTPWWNHLIWMDKF
jgi:arylsulfatase A